jgi:hypothetical protein
MMFPNGSSHLTVYSRPSLFAALILAAAEQIAKFMGEASLENFPNLDFPNLGTD